MASQTWYISMGAKRVAGNRHAAFVGSANGADVTITINTANVTKASELLDAAKLAAQQLS